MRIEETEEGFLRLSTTPHGGLSGPALIRLVRPGLIGMEQTQGIGARLIRWALSRWANRLCESLGKPVVPVWSNHTFLIVGDPEIPRIFCIGESVPKGGTVLSDFSTFLANVQEGKAKVRLFQVKGATKDQEEKASENFRKFCVGKPYDWGAYPRLIFKSLIADLCPAVAGWKWANWCTESVADAWRRWDPSIDVFQTENPTPLTAEQVAGLIPMKPGRKITLEELS